MSKLDEFIQETGDTAKDLLKKEVKSLVEDMRSDSKDFLKETGDLIEGWLIRRAKGELSNTELERLIEARKYEAEQYLNTKDIQARARVERLADRLIDLITNSAIDVIF
ncbi:hypothetical protein [Saccharospirillum alexandrii]|uniref:hypothetical protein n=1 Tax=Saccharospirillum alexandrii TaxID=2448477 RepID=UPI000FD6F57D|nr:hypothetical protein [Saccharospirillum alexandrii]